MNRYKKLISKIVNEVKIWLAIFLIIIGSNFSNICLGQTPQTEAVVLIQPIGNVTIVAMVFPRKVDHNKIKVMVREVAAANRWAVTGLSMRDEPIGGGVDAVIQTDVEFQVAGAIGISAGAFNLQLIINSFKSLKQFDLVYYIRAVTDFTGLRDYIDSNVTVQLLNAGGPYKYRINIQNPTLPMPQLPLHQSQPAPQKRTYKQNPSNSGFIYSISLVILVSLLIGAGSLGLLRRNSKIRAAQKLKRAAKDIRTVRP